MKRFISLLLTALVLLTSCAGIGDGALFEREKGTQKPEESFWHLPETMIDINSDQPAEFTCDATRLSYDGKEREHYVIEGNTARWLAGTVLEGIYTDTVMPGGASDGVRLEFTGYDPVVCYGDFVPGMGTQEGLGDRIDNVLKNSARLESASSVSGTLAYTDIYYEMSVSTSSLYISPTAAKLELPDHRALALRNLIVCSEAVQEDIDVTDDWEGGYFTVLTDYITFTFKTPNENRVFTVYKNDRVMERKGNANAVLGTIPGIYEYAFELYQSTQTQETEGG